MKSKDPRHGRPGKKMVSNGITDIVLKVLKPIGKPVHVDSVVGWV